MALFVFLSVPPTVMADLPPRPKEDEASSSDDPTGAYLQIKAGPAMAGIWSMIQWQDAHGEWHDLDGWQGSLEPDGTKTWWVAQKDFGTGPFRWLLLDSAEGEILNISDPFTLPSSFNEMGIVEMEPSNSQ